MIFFSKVIKKIKISLPTASFFYILNTVIAAKLFLVCFNENIWGYVEKDSKML